MIFFKFSFQPQIVFNLFLFLGDLSLTVLIKCVLNKKKCTVFEIVLLMIGNIGKLKIVKIVKIIKIVVVVVVVVVVVKRFSL